MEEIYTGAASFGKLMAYITAAIATVVGIYMIYRGVTSNPNPSDVAQGRAVSGSSLIGMGVFVILVSWVLLYLALRFKFFAAATGVADVIGLF